MKILILGENAKEQALAQALDRSGQHEILVVPGNPGTTQFEQSVEILPEAEALADAQKAVEAFQPDVVWLCDETYISQGWKEKLESAGVEVIAPALEAAALIEAKPQWAGMMKETQIPVADFVVFHDYDTLLSFSQKFPAPIIFKELTGKKRFAIPYNEEEAEDTLDEWFEDGQTDVMVSEFQDGCRFNLPVLVWKERVIPLLPFVIERGIYEQEDDAQAKGMGAICPAYDLLTNGEDADKAIDWIIVPFLKELQKRGLTYTGFLSGEFVSTDEGPVCVNLKTGLSETGASALFPLLESDLMEAWQALKEGRPADLTWTHRTAVSTVMAASKYPKAPSIGSPITFDEDLEGIITCNHCKEEDGQLYTNGGRVLVVTSMGKDRQEAGQKNLESLSHVHCDDLFYRTDVGLEE